MSFAMQIDKKYLILASKNYSFLLTGEQEDTAMNILQG